MITFEDSVDLEQTVIGSIMALSDPDNVMVSKVLSTIKESAFSKMIHRLIYRAIKKMSSRSEMIDLISLNEECKKISNCGDQFVYLAEMLKESSALKLNIVHHAKLLRESAIERYTVQKLHEAIEMFNDRSVGDVYQRIGLAETLIGEIGNMSMRNEKGGLKHVSEIAGDWLDNVEQVQNDGYDKNAFSTGIESLDDILGMSKFKKGSLLAIGARPKMGKAQPLTSNVLLKNGLFKKMGDIQLGDKLASVDGDESEVCGIYPQGLRDVYELETSDGRLVKCDGEHLWDVESSKFKGVKTVTTLEIKTMLSKVRYKNRLRLVSHNGDFGYVSDIGIDAWLLGYLIGDGCFVSSGVKFAASEEYIVNKVISAIGKNHSITNSKVIDYRIKGTAGSNEILNAIRKLGLGDKKAVDKFIPEIVFKSNKKIREEFLTGLIESDGGTDDGRLLYYTSSERLKSGVIRLIRSLGGKAVYSTKIKNEYAYKGEKRLGQKSYRISIALDNISDLIGSPRISTNRTRSCNPTIKSVNMIENELCQCIRVTHSKSLYITDDYTVTHNTAFMTLLTDHFALNLKETVAVFSMEMPSVSIFERAMSTRSLISPAEFYRANQGAETQGRTDTAFKEMIDSKMYVEDTPALSLRHIQKESRRLRKENGSIGLICVDYLTLMEAEKADRNDLAYGMITKGLKNLAKELDCVVCMLTQLNRGLESRTDKRPMPADSRDTGQIEQDVDYWIGLYKESVYVDDAINNGLTEVIVRLNRHGGTGTAFVEMREGFHVPVSIQEGASILNRREQDNKDEITEKAERKKFKKQG